MTTLDEIKRQTAQARSQLTAQQENLKIQREKAEKQKANIQKAKEKLPVATSQRALRQTMAGLKGRTKRREIKKVKTGLEKQTQNVKEFKEKLTTYETEKLKPFETKLISQEAEIRRVDEYNNAVARVEKAAAKGMVWALAFYGEGLVKKLALQYQRDLSLQRKLFKEQVSEFQMQNPTEKLVVDWKNLKVTGVQSGSLQQSLSWKNYNKEINKLENLKIVNLPATTLDVQTSNALVRPTGIGMVSALSDSNINLSSANASKINDNINVSTGSSGGFISKLRSGISNIIGSGSDNKKGFNQTQSFLTGNTISAYDPSKQIKNYVPPEKTTFQKITSLPGLALVSAREWTEKQNIIRTEELFEGMGNVMINKEGTLITGEGVGLTSSPLGEASKFVKEKEELLGSGLLKVLHPNTKAIKELESYDVKIKENLNKYNNLNNYEIPKFEDDNKKNGIFDYNELSEEKQRQYDNLNNKRKKVAQEYSDLQDVREKRTEDTSKRFRTTDPNERYAGSQMGINWFGKKVYEKNVPVTELTSPFGYLNVAVSSVTEATGQSVGNVYSLFAGEEGVGKGLFKSVEKVVKGEITGKEFISGFKKSDKEFSVWDLDKGVTRVGTKEDLERGSLMTIQPEEVSKVSTKVFDLGKYFIPVAGEYLFASEIGESFSQSGYSPKRFVKEKPMEALAVLTIGTLKVFSKASKFWNKPLKFEEGGVTRLTTRGDEFLGKTIKLADKGKSARVGGRQSIFETIPSKRGTYIKRVPIKSPVVDFKSTGEIGYDITEITSKGEKNYVEFIKRQTGQVGKAGSFTEVKVWEKGNLFRKGGMKDVYSGLPIDKLGRKEALKLLENIKNKEALLRLNRPVVKKSYLEGDVTIKGYKAKTGFIQSEEQPIMLADDVLGIKTRGGRTKIFSSSGRRVSLNKGEGNLAIEKNLLLKAEKYNKNIINVKGIDVKNIVSESKIISKGKVYEPIKNVDGLTAYEESSFEHLRTFSAGKYSPATKKTFIEAGDTYLIKKTIREKGAQTIQEGSPDKIFKNLDSGKNILLQEQKQILKVAPKIKEVELVGTKVGTKIEAQVFKQDNLPFMVGGTGLVTLPFQTQGVYGETIQEFTYPGVTQFAKQSLVLEPTTQLKQDIGLKTQLKQDIGLKTQLKQDIGLKTQLKQDIGLKTQLKQDIGLKTQLKQDIGLKTQLKQDIGLKTQLKQDIGLKTQLKQDIGLKTELKTSQRTSQKKSQKKSQRIKKEFDIYPKPKIIIPTTSKTPYKNILKKVREEYFEIFEKKKGKEVSIGTAKGIEKAAKKLKTGLKSGLEASGFIVEKRTGKKVKLSTILPLLGEEFRASKTTPYFAVQKKTKRLGTRTETKKIQKERTFFRRTNGKFKFF